MDTSSITLSLMTYNIGKLKDDPQRAESILQVINNYHPDILALQEITITDYQDGRVDSFVDVILEQVGYRYGCFGRTISLLEHFHLGKDLFIDGIFQGWKNWQQGNAIFAKRAFIDISDSQKLSNGWNVPIFKPSEYLGSRDTDPRYALLTRLDYKPLNPYIINTHLTTLVGERGKEEQIIQGKKEEAAKLRLEQTRKIISLVNKHILGKGRMLFLCGDFNAMDDEACIQDELLQKAKLVHLIPEKSEATHPKLPKPVDHIFIFPAGKCIEYQCRIVDDDITKRASDHLPVLATLDVYEENTNKYKALGKGVFPKES